MNPNPFEAALEKLPHGSEFRFLDSIHALEPGVRANGIYRVRGTEEFLRGHFPDDPLFPGVLLVESLAQLAGVVAQSDPRLTPLLGLKLTAISGAKILGTARPGQTIELSVEITGRMNNLVQARGTASVAGVMVLQAGVTLSGST